MLSFPCSQQSCGTRAPIQSGGDCQRNLHVPLSDVRMQFLFILPLQSTMLVAVWCNLANVASCNDNLKFFDQPICCNGSCRETSFIADAKALYCNDEGLQLPQWISLQRFGAFTIVKGCGPVALCGKGLVVALHSIRSPVFCGKGLNVVALHHARCPFALCGKGLIVVPSPVAILCKGFVVPSVTRGLLLPTLTNTASLAYLPYVPLAAYTLSSMYFQYSTSAYSHRWLLRGRIYLSSHPANENIKM